VAKERLIQTVWSDTFVTDDVLTRAISELRRVFGDDAKASRFIQTIPKSGYRLIAPVSSSGADQGSAALGQAERLSTVAAGDDQVVAPPTDAGRVGAPEHSGWRSPTLRLWVIGLAVVILVGVGVWPWLGADTQPPRVTIAVLPFEHIGGPEREYLTDGLTEEISASLGQIDPTHLSVQGRTSTKRYKSTSKSLAEIGRELGVEYLVEGS